MSPILESNEAKNMRFRLHELTELAFFIAEPAIFLRYLFLLSLSQFLSATAIMLHNPACPL